MYQPTHLSGLFSCDFPKSNLPLVQISPGQMNTWVIGRRAGASKTADDVVEHWLEDVDTNLILRSNAPFAIRAGSAADMRAFAASMKVSVKQNLATAIGSGTMLGSAPQYFLVVFSAPTDAPSTIPWPVEGCPEEADWALLSVLTPTPMSSTAPPSAADATPEAAEARRLAAEKALMAALQQAEPTTPAWLWWALGLTAAGAGYYAWRKGKLPGLQPQRR